MEPTGYLIDCRDLLACFCLSFKGVASSGGENRNCGARPAQSWRLALFRLGVLAVGGYDAWTWYQQMQRVQITDDAYVRGEITAISPRVTGYVT